MASEIKVDTISEKTSAGGVTIDGLLIKDGGISGDVSLIGTTPTFTIGDAGAEDATLLFDGNAQDFHIGLDDTADDLVIGVGSTLGTTTAIAIDENANTTFSGTVTVGVDDTGKDVKLFGATSGKYWLWDESADGVVAVSNLQQTGTITVGVDDTGHDVKLFGATASSYMLWDESADDLNLIASGLGVTTAKDLGTGIHVRTADSSGTVYAGADELVLENNGEAGITILSATNSYGNIFFGDSGSNVIGKIYYNHNDNSLNFFSGATWGLYMSSSSIVFNEDSNDIDFRVESNNDANAFKIDAGSDFIRFFGTAASLETNSGDDYGVYSDNNGETSISTNEATFAVNRQNSEGTVIRIAHEGEVEGTISVSGTTVAYNTFCGTHWSRLADNSKPTILRGTVMESIATMIDWYQVEYEIDITKEYKDGDTIPLGKEIGDEYDSKTSYKESIALPDGKSVGDNHTITVKGIERTGKIIKEGNEQLPMCKISNTADSKAVYGVFMAWDDQDDGLDGDVNDMYVAALGAFVVRVHKDETVAIGNWLVSNGDGTAKVLAGNTTITADVQSSLIGKVTSTTKTHTHADDSYCVPCTLHCG